MESGEKFEISEAAREDWPFDEPKGDEPVIVVFDVWSTCARLFERAASAATDAVLLMVRDNAKSSCLVQAEKKGRDLVMTEQAWVTYGKEEV